MRSWAGGSSSESDAERQLNSSTYPLGMRGKRGMALLHRSRFECGVPEEAPRDSMLDRVRASTFCCIKRTARLVNKLILAVLPLLCSEPAAHLRQHFRASETGSLKRQKVTSGKHILKTKRFTLLNTTVSLSEHREKRTCYLVIHT